MKLLSSMGVVDFDKVSLLFSQSLGELFTLTRASKKKQKNNKNCTKITNSEATAAHCDEPPRDCYLFKIRMVVDGRWLRWLRTHRCERMSTCCLSRLTERSDAVTLEAWGVSPGYVIAPTAALCSARD